MVRTRRSKRELCNDVLQRLMTASSSSGSTDDGISSSSSSFPDQLWTHFDRLPSRYPKSSIQLRLEELKRQWDGEICTKFDLGVIFNTRLFDDSGKEILLATKVEEYAFDVHSNRPEDVLIHMKLLQQVRDPTFQLSFEILPAQVTDDQFQSEEKPSNNKLNLQRPMHEIIFSSVDRPKLLSELTTLLAELNLNIQEAHAYSTSDGFSLIIVVVDGWPYQEIDLLRVTLQKQIDKAKSKAWTVAQPIFPKVEMVEEQLPSCSITIPRDGTDDWEIDAKLLTFDRKLASGSYGDLFRGTYCSQDVAIKLLKPEIVSPDMLREFAQEIYIMRKVRHKNVVQFIGACTKPPILCIVTEFMNGGSVFDIIHNLGGIFDLPAVVRIAIDVSKGMDYLHQCDIIHRDLKTANLLMDEKEVVKVADFGVARVKDQSGVMTAETGTYRWMAPEVIEHKPYDHKADVFSFGIVLWELLSGKLPYEDLTPLQAAVAVVQKGLRPPIPEGTHPKLIELLQKCWQYDPSLRPNFSEILDILYSIAKEVCPIENQKKAAGGGFLSAFLHRK